MTSRRQVSAGRSEARRRTHGKKTRQHALHLRLKPTQWFSYCDFQTSVSGQSAIESVNCSSISSHLPIVIPRPFNPGETQSSFPGYCRRQTAKLIQPGSETVDGRMYITNYDPNPSFHLEVLPFSGHFPIYNPCFLLPDHSIGFVHELVIFIVYNTNHGSCQK